jgi:Ca2+-binding RTX toxin-like protein
MRETNGCLIQLKRLMMMATNRSCRARHRRMALDGSESLEPRQLLSATPIGTEFQVNSTSVGDQTTNALGQGGSVAMDADGDFVVVWENEPDQGIAKVTAQRYDAAGTKLGGEIQVNTVDVPWGELNSVAVAMDADGDFVATWTRRNSDYLGIGVYAQRFNAAGTKQGSEFRVNPSDGFEYVNSAMVAMDDAGDFIITWAGPDENGYGIYAQRYNAVGVKQGASLLVNTTTPGEQNAPAVAMDANGDFVVTWSSDSQNSGHFDIYARRYNATGIPQGSEFLVNSYTTNNQRDSSVAMSSDGHFVVTWSSYEQIQYSNWDIYGQRYNAAGQMQGDEFRINTTIDFDQKEAAVAMDDNGDFVVTWSSYYQDAFSGWGVYAREFNAHGVPQSGEIGVNTSTADDQRYPSVAMDAYGDFVVAWSSDSYEGVGQDGEGSGVFARRYQVNAEVSLCNNALIITGTPRQDVITVAEAAVLTVTLNGDVYTFSPTSVGAIIIDGLPGNDSITINSLALGTTLRADGNSGNDTLIVNNAVKAPTVLLGGAGNDSLAGGGGADALMGGAGNDTYSFDTDLALGSDTISDIGGGIDTLNFAATTTRAVNVNLGNAAAQVVNAGLTLRLSANNTIENVIGGSLGDTLTGNGLTNVLTGGAGNDTLTGGAGNDTYSFDTDLSLGSDVINEAGGGVDTLHFATTTTRAVTVNLGNAASQVVNAGLTLTLSANNTIENVIGGALGDTLTGNGLANVLAGGAGNDNLNGGTEKDILIGGIGADILTGGSGENLFLGARYTSETNVTALIALRSEWTSASSYSNRVAHLLGTLAGGLNGSYKLTSATVKEDSAKDTLKGNAGKDWYLRNSVGATVANRDAVTDVDLDSVFTEISSWL